MARRSFTQQRFKLVVYTPCAGNKTCGERFGSYGYEEIDAKQYAEWGIDLLKYDYCFVPKGKAIAIPRFIKWVPLRSPAAPLYISVCEWGKMNLGYGPIVLMHIITEQQMIF